MTPGKNVNSFVAGLTLKTWRGTTTLIALFLLSCNSGYREMAASVAGQTMCLDTLRTDTVNAITLGKGKLNFLADKTFSITLDNFPGKKIVGRWDLCCSGSDYGNYVFSVAGLPDWKQAEPNLFVVLDNHQRRLFFKACK